MAIWILVTEILLESVVEELRANDRDGSGDLSQKEFKKLIRTAGLRRVATMKAILWMDNIHSAPPFRIPGML